MIQLVHSTEKYLILAHGKQLTALEDGKTVKQTDENFLDSKIVSIGSHKDTLAVGTMLKSIVLISLKTWQVLATYKSPKKTTKLIFTPSGDLLASDKFGDVYKYSNSKPRLLVGHVSILTDLVFSHDKRHLITADRDEKIRISEWPNTFVIERFLLGHTQYVSSLAYLGHHLVSGGGDPFLIFWNEDGTIHKQAGLEDDKINVLGLRVLDKEVAVAIEKLDKILLVDAEGEIRTLELESTPAAICVHKKHLYVTLENGGIFTTDPKQAEALKALELKEELDPVSKMRKFSQWHPVKRELGEDYEAKKQENERLIRKRGGRKKQKAE
ncbi:WD40-repeat-containing domain protein [Gorgonomyces haynaldii]|nr:WD40-repeat-containing domain protein [Gorgonomyces haynaldii]